jgi:hypothetical protein
LSPDEPPEAEFAPASAAHAASAEWQTLFHPLLLPPPPSHSSLQLTLFHKLHILPSAPPAVSTIPSKLSQKLVKLNSQLQPKLQQKNSSTIQQQIKPNWHKSFTYNHKYDSSISSSYKKIPNR